MGWYQEWAAKQKGKTSVLIFGAVSASLFTWISYRYYFVPWRTKKRLKEAEDYAEYLWKSEK